MHIGKTELLLALVLHILRILLAEEALQFALLAPCSVFFRGHQQGGIQIVVANLRTNDIHARRVVILHLLTDILRESQVNGKGVKV